ncbi:MAG: hypothetical protein ACFFBH_12870 [Promethearchaeota archaeon]
MQNIRKYYFYRCYHCGEWYYCNKIIKTKKCWRCNHSFTFKPSTKFSKYVTLSQAIQIVKYLKEKAESEISPTSQPQKN